MSIRTELELSTRGFNRNLDAATDRVRQRSREMRASTRGLGSEMGSSVGASFVALGRGLVPAVTAMAAFRAGLSSVQVSMQRANQEMALGAVSTEDVAEQMERLRDLAESPGLGFDQVVQGSTRLQAVGFSAAQAEEAMLQFGNALALVGGGKEQLDGVLLALTQIVAKGVVSAEEINQIAERLPQIRTLMQQAFGTADTEALQKMGIGAEQFISAMVEAASGLERAAATSAASLQNLQDDWKAFMESIGDLVEPALEPLFSSLSSLLERARAVTADITDMMKRDMLLMMGVETNRDFREGGANRTTPAAPVVPFRPRAVDETTAEYEAARAAFEANQRGGAGSSAADQMAEAKKRQAEEEAAEAEKKRTKAELEALEEDRRRARFDQQFEDYARSQNQIAVRAREAEQERVESLRAETAAGAFDLMSPAQQFQQLKNTLSASLGVSITSESDIRDGLDRLNDLADDLAAEGDLAGEAEVRQQIIAAQRDYGRFRSLGSALASGDSVGEVGSVQRLVNQVMGRDPQQIAADEARRSRVAIEDQRDILDQILAKMDEPPPTDTFGGSLPL